MYAGQCCCHCSCFMLLLFICHSTSTITDIKQQYYSVITTKTRTNQSTWISQSCCPCSCWYVILLLLFLLLFNCNCVATITHAKEQNYEMKQLELYSVYFGRYCVNWWPSERERDYLCADLKQSNGHNMRFHRFHIVRTLHISPIL